VYLEEFAQLGVLLLVGTEHLDDLMLVAAVDGVELEHADLRQKDVTNLGHNVFISPAFL